MMAEYLGLRLRRAYSSGRPTSKSTTSSSTTGNLKSMGKACEKNAIPSLGESECSPSMKSTKDTYSKLLVEKEQLEYQIYLLRTLLKKQRKAPTYTTYVHLQPRKPSSSCKRRFHRTYPARAGSETIALGSPVGMEDDDGIYRRGCVDRISISSSSPTTYRIVLNDGTVKDKVPRRRFLLRWDAEKRISVASIPRKKDVKAHMGNSSAATRPKSASTRMRRRRLLHEPSLTSQQSGKSDSEKQTTESIAHHQVTSDDKHNQNSKVFDECMHPATSFGTQSRAKPKRNGVSGAIRSLMAKSRAATVIQQAVRRRSSQLLLQHMQKQVQQQHKKDFTTEEDGDDYSLDFEVTA